MPNLLWGVDERIAKDMIEHLTRMEQVALLTVYQHREEKLTYAQAARHIGVTDGRVGQLVKSAKTKLIDMARRIRERSNNDAEYYKHTPEVMW